MKKLLSLCLMVFCTTLLIAQKTSYDLPAGYDRANHEFSDKTPKSFSDHILPEGTRTMRSDFSEGFDDILLLPPLGWALINNSNPVGTTGWFQGSPGVFAAHSGDPDSYIGANFNNTAGVGTISNWLLTPEISMSDGDVITFWTRTATNSIWADRLQLRLSTNGNSTDVGTLATDVGDFSTLLLDINPTLIGNGYPQTWTQYSVTLSGIGEDVDGRIAFRYFVTNGGPAGDNSNYIGIDTFSYESNGEEPPPPPPAYCDAGPTTLNDSNVERVLISGENDTEIDHTGCPGVLGVEDLTHLSVDLTRGETYTLEVTFGTCGSAFPGAGSVWIDWGQDFEFDPADLIHESTGTPGTAPWDGPVTISFTVPANAELGNTVMRVMQREFGSLPLDPCGTFPWGSVMDFGINVIDPPLARVQIIHNSAAVPVEVDIFADGELLLGGLDFRHATPFLDLPAGVEIELNIAPAGAGIDASVFNTTVEFDPDGTYIVVAAGDLIKDTSFNIFKFDEGREVANEPANTDVLAFHGSTDAGTVSIWETAFFDGEIIGDFEFGDFEGYLELATANYILEVRDAAGENTIASYYAPLANLGLEGQALVVLASGFLNPPPDDKSDPLAFGLYVALSGGGPLIPLGDPPLIPVSNWALYLGVFLMISFVIIRFRRMI